MVGDEERKLVSPFDQVVDGGVMTRRVRNRIAPGQWNWESGQTQGVVTLEGLGNAIRLSRREMVFSSKRWSTRLFFISLKKYS